MSVSAEDKLKCFGTVLSVRGSVADIEFKKNLPPIYQLLRTGNQGSIAIEVQTHLDADRVRGIALTPTQGLARGMEVIDTGGPLIAPVGKNTLARMFDVFGNTIDLEPPISGGEWRHILRTQSSSKIAAKSIVGARLYDLAKEIRQTLAQYEELKDIITTLGLEQLSTSRPYEQISSP